MVGASVSGLQLVKAFGRSSALETELSTSEIAAAVFSGVVTVIKGAFDADEMRRLRSAIVSAELPFREPGFHDAESWRNRREVRAQDGQLEILYDSTFLAVDRPADQVGRAARSTADRLAAFWRALTGDEHTFVSVEGRRALRCWAMQYPRGGGCFGWHQHKLAPTKIGMILALSKVGVDFISGGTEFKTPFGIVDVTPHHDVGDLCLFRYDLQHRVAAVDPEWPRVWDESGRWTFLIQGDPRPVGAAAT